MESNTSLQLPLPTEPNESLSLPLWTMQPRKSCSTACVAGEQAECKLDSTMLELSRGRAFAPLQRQHMNLPASVQGPRRRNSFHGHVPDKEEAPPNVPVPIEPTATKSPEHAPNTHEMQPSKPASPQLPTVKSQQDQDEFTGVALRHLEATSQIGAGSSSNSRASRETASANSLDADNPHSAQTARAAANRILGSQYDVGRIIQDTIELGGQIYTYKNINEEFVEAAREWSQAHTM
ncbi:hypothetical protein PMIN04_011416 [Paraphaeosphaeria minitans]